MLFPVRTLAPVGIAGKAPSSLLSGLISYWKLEEASGTRNDSHSTNHLTDNNTVTQAVGKVGNAAQFTAANSESLSCASNASLQCGDIDFTVVAWVYFDSIASQNAIVSRQGQEYLLDCSSTFSNKFVFRVYQGAGATEKTAVSNTFGAASTGTWYFLIGQHDAANDLAGISVNNGALDTVATGGALSAATAANLRIGARDAINQRFITGRVDEVGFWKRLLTSDEKAHLYNSGNGRSYPF